MEHYLLKIKHKKMFFVKSFVISIVVMILLCLITTLFFNFMANMNYRFYGITADEYAKVFVMIMGLWKILIIQFTLIPAIATMFIENHFKKEHNDMMNEEC